MGMIFPSPVPKKACISSPSGSRCMLFAGQVMKISYPPVVQRVITTSFFPTGLQVWLGLAWYLMVQRRSQLGVGKVCGCISTRFWSSRSCQRGPGHRSATRLTSHLQLSQVGFLGPFRNEPRHEKNCLRGFRQGKAQTGLLSYRD